MPNPILCVFLLNCFTSQVSKLKVPDTELEINCPNRCICYSAPEEGRLSETAFSLICDVITDADLNQLINQLQSLKELSINTLAFKGIDFNKLPENFLNGLSINNLIFTESGISVADPSNGMNIFSGLNSDNLHVITFINVKLQIGYSSFFPWGVFELFKNLKAIHIEGEFLYKISSEFKKIPSVNILTATFENNKLRIIENGVFEGWRKLRMLTIIKNDITDLNWFPSTLQELWYLDLRSNKLWTIPEDLAKRLKSLKVLKIADNKIRILTSNFFSSLSLIQEFSFNEKPDELDFEGKAIKGKEPNYFYATTEMSWIIKYYKSYKDPFQRPLFFYDSLHSTYLIGFNEDIYGKIYLSEHFDYDNQFNYDYTDYVKIANNKFRYRNHEIFLSGVNIDNIHWVDSSGVVNENFLKESLVSWLNEIQNSGGNSIKIYLHGQFLKMDIMANLELHHYTINVLKFFLFEAEKSNIFVILSLWSGDEASNIISSDILLPLYYRILDNLLKELSNFKSLFAYDIIDQVEELIQFGKFDNNPCFNTIKLMSASDNKLPINQVLQFVSQHASYIHKYKNFVTVGISYKFTIFATGMDYFSDECLKFENIPKGSIDFYQILMKNEELEVIETLYPEDINKPIIIGRFVSSQSGMSYGISVKTAYLYDISGMFVDDLTIPDITDGMRAFKDSKIVKLDVTILQEPDWSKLFACDKDGNFPNPYDCRKYFYCSPNIISAFEVKVCEDNKVFVDSLQQCDVESVECLKKQIPGYIS